MTTCRLARNSASISSAVAGAQPPSFWKWTPYLSANGRFVSQKVSQSMACGEPCEAASYFR